jgi:hypothetical protein
MQFISVAIFAPLQELGNIILAHREAEASLLNFEALMDKPIERRPPEPVEIGPIESCALTRRALPPQGRARRTRWTTSRSRRAGRHHRLRRARRARASRRW